MKLKKTDKEIVNNHKCQTKGCSRKSIGIAETMFLCEMHYREIVPERERGFGARLHPRSLI